MSTDQTGSVHTGDEGEDEGSRRCTVDEGGAGLASGCGMRSSSHGIAVRLHSAEDSARGGHIIDVEVQLGACWTGLEHAACKQTSGPVSVEASDEREPAPRHVERGPPQMILVPGRPYAAVV